MHKSIQVKTSTFCINIDIKLNEEFLGYRSIRNKSFFSAVLLSYFEILQMNLPYAYLNFGAIDHDMHLVFVDVIPNKFIYLCPHEKHKIDAKL